MKIKMLPNKALCEYLQEGGGEKMRVLWIADLNQDLSHFPPLEEWIISFCLGTLSCNNGSASDRHGGTRLPPCSQIHLQSPNMRGREG